MLLGDQWRNNSRKNEWMEPKQKQYPAVVVTGDRSKVWCCKEQYCIGTWNVRFTNQGKLEVVKEEMARVNVDIHPCYLLFDHFQFALIHGPDIPGSYAILLFTASDLASITSHIHNWVLFLLWLIPSFFLELFLHWYPVAYWAPNVLGNSSFSILSFCLFILFMRFSRQEYWSGLPFPSPVDHILSDLSTMTRPSWVAPQSMA